MNDKPDDRRDNAQKIKDNIAHTKHNIELAEDMIATTSDKKLNAICRRKTREEQRQFHL